MISSLIEISIMIVDEMLPKFPSEKVSWVRMGDCGKVDNMSREDRLYVFLSFLQR
jgi:hypothetical protein